MEEVRDIAIAIVPEGKGKEEKQWTVYILNMKNAPIRNVLINAEGRGLIDGEERHTATLRFFFDKLEALSSRSVEIIMPEAFALNNQYWVSFYEGERVFDKRYVFAANTISEDRLVMVPLLDKPGVFIR